jgi:hypothetical protein
MEEFGFSVEHPPTPGRIADRLSDICAGLEESHTEQDKDATAAGMANLRRLLLSLDAWDAVMLHRADIIARLRDSKEVGGARNFADGREAGEKWARETAKYRHLKRIADAPPDKGIADVATHLLNDNPNTAPSSRVIHEFLHENIGEDYHDRRDSQELARGFVEGAKAVWDDVKNEI